MTVSEKRVLVAQELKQIIIISVMDFLHFHAKFQASNYLEVPEHAA